MALKKIIEDFENEKEPLLEEMKEWFKGSPYKINATDIQRYFNVGFRRANRAVRQLKQ